MYAAPTRMRVERCQLRESHCDGKHHLSGRGVSGDGFRLWARYSGKLAALNFGIALGGTDMPYTYKAGAPIQSDKCGGCRFEVWDNERHEYCCAVYGCYEHSKYIPYKGEYDEKRGWV